MHSQVGAMKSENTTTIKKLKMPWPMMSVWARWYRLLCHDRSFFQQAGAAGKPGAVHSLRELVGPHGSATIREWNLQIGTQKKI